METAKRPSLPMCSSTSHASFSRKHSLSISIIPSSSSPSEVLNPRSSVTAVTSAEVAVASAEIAHMSMSLARRTRLSLRRGEAISGSTQRA